jgi:hypothetical protein
VGNHDSYSDQYFKRQLSIRVPTIPGMLTFSRKDQEYRAEGNRCARMSRKKSWPAFAQSLKAAPLHLYPSKSPAAAEKAPDRTQDVVLKFP